MKFRYYIADLFEGTVWGTNDENKAKGYAQCADYYVIDTEASVWIPESGEPIEIEEIADIPT